MKKSNVNKIVLLCTLLGLLNLYSCSKAILNDGNSQAEVFQSFWQIMDERYVFFNEKHVNWDSIHKAYYPKFELARSDNEAFILYNEILYKLKDRHVLLIKNDTCVQYKQGLEFYLKFGKIYTHYQLQNFKDLGSTQIGQLPNNMAYLRIVSEFNSSNEAALPLNEYNFNNGFILDLRDFSGGDPFGKNMQIPFWKGEKTICYFDTKSSPARNDFTELMEIKINGSGTIPEYIPLVVLINENTFSLGNGIASLMKDITNATLIGTKTYGGGGAALRVFLPAGWGLQYTFTRHYNLNKELTEEGILPHIDVTLPREFWHNEHFNTGEDPQLEKAIEILSTIN